MSTVGNMLFGPTFENTKDQLANKAYDTVLSSNDEEAKSKKESNVLRATSEKKFGVKINRGKRVTK